jgi:putative DNA primase/helicase
VNRTVADFEILADHKKRKHNRVGNIEDRTALEFAAQHAADFRYVAIWNRWMRYSDDRWQPETTLKAFDQARKLCREAGDAKAKTVAPVVTLARADRAIVARDDQWDDSVWTFNLQTDNQQRKDGPQ